MTIWYFIPTGLYAIFMLFLLFHWKMLPIFHYKNRKYGKNITVLVPFRNEILRLEPLLNALGKQNLEKEHWEIIFIDDHSTDNSAQFIAEKLMNTQLHYRILALDTHTFGKKQAITLGVSNANYPYILCTDADCVVGSNWLCTYADFLEDKKADMVLGAVAIEGNAIFARLQSIEFASLIAVGAIMINLNKPLFGNAANMLFTKKIFNEVGGYAENLHIPSGDDEFLIKKIQAIGKIVFLKSSTAIVLTKAMDSFADFTAQRLRWASKWDMHKSFFHSFLALVVFFLQFYWIFLILGFYSVGGNSLYFFLSFIVLKIAPEFVLLQIIMRFFNLQKNTMLIPIVQLIYPFYVLFIGLRSLSGKYEWKGRVFKKN